jgi:hypothetical protein
MCELPVQVIQKDKNFVVQVIQLKDVESDPNKQEGKKLVIKQKLVLADGVSYVTAMVTE